MTAQSTSTNTGKKRGRPAKATRDVRPKRVPVSGRRNVLTVEGKDEDYHYHWVNDDSKGLIQRFKDGGYELVEDVSGQYAVGERSVDDASGATSFVSRPVGNGITAYLMRIRQEWYDEDREANMELLAAREADMKRTLNSGKDGTYGNVALD
jgi:hypothetical protein